VITWPLEAPANAPLVVTASAAEADVVLCVETHPQRSECLRVPAGGTRERSFVSAGGSMSVSVNALREATTFRLAAR